MAREQAKDFIFQDDLVIRGGDFLVQDSDAQHIQHILQADRGQWRQWPLVGAGLMRALNSPSRVQELKQLIKLQLKADNMLTQRLKIVHGEQLGIEVKAKRQE